MCVCLCVFGGLLACGMVHVLIKLKLYDTVKWHLPTHRWQSYVVS